MFEMERIFFGTKWISISNLFFIYFSKAIESNFSLSSSCNQGWNQTWICFLVIHIHIYNFMFFISLFIFGKYSKFFKILSAFRRKFSFNFGYLQCGVNVYQFDNWNKIKNYLCAWIDRIGPCQRNFFSNKYIDHSKSMNFFFFFLLYWFCVTRTFSFICLFPLPRR